MNFAEAYLKSGAPFMGDSSTNDVPIIKKAGGKWTPQKKQWRAPDIAVLKALIETGRWRPSGADSMMVLRAIETQHVLAEEKEREAREAMEAKKAASALTPEQLLAKQRKEAGIPDDTPEQLKDLLDNYQITQEMLKVAFSWGSLGPKSGRSDALRVLCALRLNILTKEEVWCGEQNEDLCTRNARRMKEERMEREAQAKRDGTIQRKKMVAPKVSAPSQAIEPVAPVAPVAPVDDGRVRISFLSPEVQAVMKENAAARGTAARPQSPAKRTKRTKHSPYTRDMLYSEGGWQHGRTDEEEEVEVREKKPPSPKIHQYAPVEWTPDTMCKVCRRPVADQFMDCGCPEAHWVRCVKCGEKYRDDAKAHANLMCSCMLR